MCGACMEARPPFDRVIAAAVFAEPLSGMIHAFKYGRATYLKSFLGRLLFDAVRTELDTCDIVTAVPLHCTRTLMRGYNQAALLAGEVARLGRKRLVTGVLRRLRPTRAQVGLPHDLRQINVRDAFAARDVDGKAVMVVDDVITTSSTAVQVSGALKRAGASRVVFAAVGRVCR